MLIVIERDSATRVPKEVADVEAARAFEAQGFAVHIVNEDGSTSPLPAAERAPEEEAPKKKGKA